MFHMNEYLFLVFFSCGRLDTVTISGIAFLQILKQYFLSELPSKQNCAEHAVQHINKASGGSLHPAIFCSWFSLGAPVPTELFITSF